MKSQLRRFNELGGTAQEPKETIYKVGGLQINDDLKQVTVDGEFVKLTPIEYNILLLLMKNQGKVFSINQIMNPSGMKRQLVRITQLQFTFVISEKK